MTASGYLNHLRKVGVDATSEIGRVVGKAVEMTSRKISETFNRISGKNVENRLDEFAAVYGRLLANMDENIDSISETCIETQHQVRAIALLQDEIRSALAEQKRHSWKLTLSLALSSAALVGMLVLGVYILTSSGR